MAHIRKSAGAIAIAAAIASLAWPSPVRAQEPKPMDIKDVDPAMLNDMYGNWEIQDAKGRKRCRVTLKRDETIGGSQIDIAKGCAKTFPIMDEITAWRLYEGWAIGLADATRKLRIRFTTPDERYIAQPETDGIFTIVKK